MVCGLFKKLINCRLNENVIFRLWVLCYSKGVAMVILFYHLRQRNVYTQFHSKLEIRGINLTGFCDILGKILNKFVV